MVGSGGVHPNAGPARGVPVLTAVVLTATVLGTLSGGLGPGVFDALRRDPTDLGRGQLWRVLTPVLVQSDHSPLAIVGAFVVGAVVGVAGEWLLPRRERRLLYLLGAPAGHGIGEAFQPGQSGTSVAFAGILGGRGARILFDHDPRWKLWRIRFAALIPLAILDTALRDIHGAPFLIGLAVGSAFELRGRAATEQSRPAQANRSGGTMADCALRSHRRRCFSDARVLSFPSKRAIGTISKGFCRNLKPLGDTVGSGHLHAGVRQASPSRIG
jgi:rhomboid protease GluP